MQELTIHIFTIIMKYTVNVKSGTRQRRIFLIKQR